MKKKFLYLTLSLIFLLVGFVSCAEERTIFPEGSGNLKKAAADRAIEAMVLICTEKDGSGQIIGRGAVVKGKYVLTANHVVSVIPSGNYYLLVGDKYYGPARPIFANALSDFALLEIPGAFDLPSLEVGDSDKLQPGALIYYIGFQNKIEERILKRGEATFLTSSSLEFFPRQNIIPGESGAPVLILENDKFKIIGILQAVGKSYVAPGENDGLAILINPVVSAIEKGLGIDIRN